MIDFLSAVVFSAALVLGLAVLVKPAWLKRHSRWDGAGLLMLAPVAVGISNMMNPKVTRAGETLDGVRQSGIEIALIFGCLAVGAFVLAANRAKVGRISGKSAGQGELSLEDSLRLQREWQRGAKERVPEAQSLRPSRNRDKAEARLRAIGAQQAVAPEPMRPVPQPRKPLRTPAIDRVAKAVAGKSVPVAMPVRRKPKPAEIEELIDLRGRGKSSGWAGFMHYTDANGSTSARRIVCRSISGHGQPETVTAFCCERQAHRTFRIDRIDELICIETGEVLDPVSHFHELWATGALKVADKTLTDFARILVFMARCDGEFHPLELKEVEAALWRYGVEFGVDDKTIKTAVRGLGRIAPDDEDFVAGLARITEHRESSRLCRLLLDAIDKVAGADGIVRQVEANWMGEVNAALKGAAFA